MILPMGIARVAASGRRSPGWPRPGAGPARLGPMDLPAHHPERLARGDAGTGRALRGARSPVTDARPRSAFAHASEAELARILDFYEVRWEYEPHTFPILWDSTAPWSRASRRTSTCPDLDLYVELTTLRQRLVRKKNRKLRRLRELYPDIRIKLFYARDFRALMLKYGRLALADELTGDEGQATPPASRRDAVERRDARRPAARVRRPPRRAAAASAGDARAAHRRRSRRRAGAPRRGPTPAPPRARLAAPAARRRPR